MSADPLVSEKTFTCPGTEGKLETGRGLWRGAGVGAEQGFSNWKREGRQGWRSDCTRSGGAGRGRGALQSSRAPGWAGSSVRVGARKEVSTDHQPYVPHAVQAEVCRRRDPLLPTPALVRTPSRPRVSLPSRSGVTWVVKPGGLGGPRRF